MAGKKDFSQVAHDVFMQATGQAPEPKRDTTRQIASRKGGLKGGKGRMASLTPEERSELAKKAATARWHADAPASKAGAVKIEKRSVKQP